MLMISIYDSIYLRKKLKYNLKNKFYHLDNSEFIIIQNTKNKIILIIKEINQKINPHNCYQDNCISSCNYNKDLILILIDNTLGWVSKNDFINI